MNHDLISFITGIIILLFYLWFSALTEMGTKLPNFLKKNK